MNFASHPNTARELLSNPQKAWEFISQCLPGNTAAYFTNPNHQGFRFIGKLKGAERSLFQHLLCCFVENHCRNANDYFDAPDDVDDIWHGASPHLRARICAEVAVGLLVPDEPLPPENFLHYAIFKFIMNDML